MSKGVVKEHLGKALYRVLVLPDEENGKAQVDDIEQQLADLEDPDKVDPGLLTEWDTLYFQYRVAVGDYESALQTNISTWRQSQVYDNRIGYVQIEINELQPQVSEAWQDADQAEQAMTDAHDKYIAGEITWEEYQVYVQAFNTAMQEASSLQIQLDSLEAEKAQLADEKASLPTGDTVGALKRLDEATKALLEIREDDHMTMYEQHLEYADSVVDEITGLVSDTIGYYNDVQRTNIENGERAVELEQEMADVADQIVELRSEVDWKKSVLDATEAAFEEAQQRYEDGEITWTEYMLYQNNYENALMDYNLAVFELEQAEHHLDELQQEVLTLTQVDPSPIMDDVTTIQEIQLYAAQQRDIIKGNYDRLELRKTALEKRKYEIEEILGSQKREAELWCADYTTEIPEESEVGLVDIAGLPAKQVIYPGAHNEAGYDSDRDGILESVRIQTPAQAAYNWAMLPGWQKWMPTYRVGTITAKQGDMCDVVLDTVMSPARNIAVNQSAVLEGVPIEYMNCNGAAFHVGDRVVVKFQDRDWSKPKVIGFEEEPKKCPAIVVVSIRDFTHPDYPAKYLVWDAGDGKPAEVYDENGDLVAFPCDYEKIRHFLESTAPVSGQLYADGGYWGDDFLYPYGSGQIPQTGEWFGCEYPYPDPGTGRCAGQNEGTLSSHRVIDTDFIEPNRNPVQNDLNKSCTQVLYQNDFAGWGPCCWAEANITWQIDIGAAAWSDNAYPTSRRLLVQNGSSDPTALNTRFLRQGTETVHDGTFDDECPQEAGSVYHFAEYMSESLTLWAETPIGAATICVLQRFREYVDKPWDGIFYDTNEYGDELKFGRYPVLGCFAKHVVAQAFVYIFIVWFKDQDGVYSFRGPRTVVAIAAADQVEDGQVFDPVSQEEDGEFSKAIVKLIEAFYDDADLHGASPQDLLNITMSMEVRE